MDSLWTVVGLAVVILGLLTASAIILFTVSGRGLRASSPGTSGGPAGTPSKDQVSHITTPGLPSKHKGAGTGYGDAELIARTLIVAQKNADDLARAAQARADEIVANAEAIANTVLQSARDEASQILQKTRDEAEAITRSVKQQAAGWLTLLKTESDQMVRSAHMAFREAQRSVEQNVMSFPSELERHVADWVASMPDGGQGAAGSGHVPTIDPRTGDLARSFALVDASAATLGADAVTPPSKSGRS